MAHSLIGRQLLCQSLFNNLSESADNTDLGRLFILGISGPATAFDKNGYPPPPTSPGPAVGDVCVCGGGGGSEDTVRIVCSKIDVAREVVPALQQQCWSTVVCVVVVAVVVVLFHL